jgi:23S rRNA pseudouridine2605 synthase
MSASAPSSTGRERLHVYLARNGVASRRESERLIAAGRVRVNGEVVATRGADLDPVRDQVEIDGNPLAASPSHVYIALHKPSGVVSSARDQSGRRVVTDLVKTSTRVFPVGRLDADSEGLLLLTNDGDFALRLTHPRFQVEKEYTALVQGVPSGEVLARLESGVLLDGELTAPASARLLEVVGGRSWVSVVLREGKKRQVRRMLAAVGHQVRRLVRIRIGSVRLGDLPPGASRPLTRAEIASLRRTTV